MLLALYVLDVVKFLNIHCKIKAVATCFVISLLAIFYNYCIYKFICIIA